ncbi:acyltransferase [Spirosoma harenae]
MKPYYLTTLTPLRGIAALMMVMFHFNLLVLPIIDPAITQLHRRWYLLVDFFFILSGFIMSYVYGNWFDERVSAGTFRRYMAARFARVYPLHFVTLLWVIGLYILITQVHHITMDATLRSVLDPTVIPLHVFMLHGFNQAWTATWNTPAWSIGSEWLVYLIFPFLMPGFRRLTPIGNAILLLLVLCTYVYLTLPIRTGTPFKPWLWHIPYMIDNIMFPSSFLRCLAGFLTGMVTCYAYYQQWGIGWLRRGTVVGVLGIGLALSYHFQLPDALTIWVFPLLILGACYNTGRLANWLQTRLFQRLGDWSYSIYMVHMPVLFSFLAIEIVNKPKPVANAPVKPITYGPEGAIICLIYIVIVLVVSFLSYRFIEVPARDYLNRRLKTKQLVV